MSKKKLVVLISGQGSNLQALIDACASKQLPAQIAAVISNRAQAFGLERAQRAGIAAIVKAKSAQQTRADYDAELAMLVAEYQPDWVVLAGWMHILSPAFLKQFPQRVINLHPAFPGQFPGLRAIERAFAAYQSGAIQETGVMVHFVPDEGVDCGPVLAQISVPIYPQDTLDSLSERMHQAEHRLLVNTLKTLTA